MKHNWMKDEDGNIDTWCWEDGFHNGVVCEDCGRCVCINCCPNWEKLDDCVRASSQETNFSYFKNLSVDELAPLLIQCKTYTDYDENYDGEWEACGERDEYITSDEVSFQDADDAIEHEIEWLNSVRKNNNYNRINHES